MRVSLEVKYRLDYILPTPDSFQASLRGCLEGLALISGQAPGGVPVQDGWDLAFLPPRNYFLKSANHTSRTHKLFGSIVMKAIPIPELGRE